MFTAGFIGVGQMGSPMARNLLKERFPVVVYDIDEKTIPHNIGLSKLSTVNAVINMPNHNTSRVMPFLK